MGCCDSQTKETVPAARQSGGPKVHIHLHTRGLAASTAFYRKFFGEDPVKSFAEYSKFLPSWAPVNLALSPGNARDGNGCASHFGIQLQSSAEVLAHLQRVKSAGLVVREEIGVNCCHANQDKFWVRDPMGVEWEVYCLNYDLQGEEPSKADSTCCVR